MLYIVSTPIGNLSDITFRAVNILSNCNYILCEDSKKSSRLLNHFKIKKKLVSFHKFSEKRGEKKILSDLESGKDIALISDGGTPLISDPGFSLLSKCIENKIKVTTIPGPCSLIAALVLSGFDPCPFQFVGFLPKKDKELESTLRRILHYGGVTLAFESPQRIISTLSLIKTIDPERKLVVARELTKIFEEVVRGSSLKLLDHFSKYPPKGEMIIAFSKGQASFKDMKVEEMLRSLKEEYGLNSKEALKLAAKLRNEPKSRLYKKMKIEEKKS